MQIGIANPSMLHVDLKVDLEDKLRRSNNILRQLYWQRAHTKVPWRLCEHATPTTAVRSPYA